MDRGPACEQRAHLGIEGLAACPIEMVTRYLRLRECMTTGMHVSRVRPPLDHARPHCLVGGTATHLPTTGLWMRARHVVTSAQCAFSCTHREQIGLAMLERTDIFPPARPHVKLLFSAMSDATLAGGCIQYTNLPVQRLREMIIGCMQHNGAISERDGALLSISDHQPNMPCRNLALLG